jgi:hypothetical protein
MAKAPVGHVQGRSGRADDISLRDYIVDGEGGEESPDAETQIEPQPQKPPGEMKKRLTNFGKFNTPSEKVDEKESINYFSALDDIIADLYEKQGAAYSVVKAVLQIFEQRGQDVPFEEERFNQICQKLSMVQASKEIAWLYGLGPDHADKVADLMIDKFFGPIVKR